jgi:hypothetical protein
VKQRALFDERKKKEEEYFVSEKLLKNTTPHTKEEKNEFVVLPTVSKPYTRTFRTCSFYTCTSAEAIRS